jgi:hypothetical protein
MVLAIQSVLQGEGLLYLAAVVGNSQTEQLAVFHQHIIEGRIERRRKNLPDGLHENRSTCALSGG